MGGANEALISLIEPLHRSSSASDALERLAVWAVTEDALGWTFTYRRWIRLLSSFGLTFVTRDGVRMWLLNLNAAYPI